MFICLRHPLLLGFCLGGSSSIVGSESGQIQNIKLQHNPIHPPPPLHTVFVHIIYSTVLIRKGKGGGVVVIQREVERANRGEYCTLSQSWVENSFMTECTQEIGHLQSINSEF